jgi:acyl-CoA oxidase
VLSNLEADRAWFIEHGRLAAGRTKQLPGVVNDLCAALRPNAQAMVEAFGVPVPMYDVPLLH